MGLGASSSMAPGHSKDARPTTQCKLTFGRTLHVQRPVSMAPLSSVSLGGSSSTSTSSPGSATCDGRSSAGMTGAASDASSILSSAEAYVRRSLEPKVKEEGPTEIRIKLHLRTQYRSQR